MFYDNLVQICKARGITPSRAAIEAGLSKSTVTKWKTTPDSKPTGAAIKKLSEYFGISVAELLGETEKENTPNEQMLTEGERELIELFRMVPADQQPVVLAMIKAALGK